MKKSKVIVFLTMFLVLAVLAFAQQEDEFFPIKLNDAVLAGIMNIFGLGLMVIIGFVKEGLKKVIKTWSSLKPAVRHGIMYAVTAPICAGAVYFTLTQMHMLTTLRMIIYSLYVWGFVNKWWKMLKEIIQKVQSQT